MMGVGLSHPGGPNRKQQAVGDGEGDTYDLSLVVRDRGALMRKLESPGSSSGGRPGNPAENNPALAPG